MTAAPLFRFTGVEKPYGGATPLRIDALALHPGERIILTVLDAMAAEMFMHVQIGRAHV